MGQSVSSIHWQQRDRVLQLSGILEKNTLCLLWKNRKLLFVNIDRIDIALLSRLDSAGLALLVNCCLVFDLKLVGVNAQVSMLIKLYNLQTVMDGHAN